MMRRVLIGCLLSQALGGSVLAEPSTRVAWTPDTLSFVKQGNPEKGQQLAQTCQSCHGPEAAAAGPEFPYLNGQLATYLYRQLHDYKDGGRPNEIMAGIVAGLSDQDMADLAQWYGRQPPMEPAVTKRVSAPPLVSSGDPKRLIAPCGICHGGSGQGEVVDTPRLAGQKAAYLKQTLLAYRSGERHNDIYRRMRAMSERLSTEEIDALAEYYAGLK